MVHNLGRVLQIIIFIYVFCTALLFFEDVLLVLSCGISILSPVIKDQGDLGLVIQWVGWKAFAFGVAELQEEPGYAAYGLVFGPPLIVWKKSLPSS